MPVDKATADAILDTYRNMFQEIQDTGVTGDAVQKMRQSLDRMEELAIQEEDVMQFTTKLTTENLFIEFSNAYSEVLAAKAQEKYSGDEGDEELLKDTLKAYRDSLKNLKDHPYYEDLAGPIRELIKLGESGVSYPYFLRIAEEKGLNQALQGDVVVRAVILSEIEFAKFMHLPLEEEMQGKILKAHDDLASVSQFHLADSFLFGLERQKIEWEYLPRIREWNLCIRIWQKLLENVYDWLDSFGNFAAHDDRWSDQRGPSYTARNIKRTQECNPGILEAWERVFNEYFNLKWEDIFSHPTFLNEYKARRVWYSDETLDLIKKAYKYAQEFQKPEDELIKDAESLYAQKKFKRPDAFQFSAEDKGRFIALYGEEKWNELFPGYETAES